MEHGELCDLADVGVLAQICEHVLPSRVGCHVAAALSLVLVDVVSMRKLRFPWRATLTGMPRIGESRRVPQCRPSGLLLTDQVPTSSSRTYWCCSQRPTSSSWRRPVTPGCPPFRTRCSQHEL